MTNKGSEIQRWKKIQFLYIDPICKNMQKQFEQVKYRVHAKTEPLSWTPPLTQIFMTYTVIYLFF